MAAVKTYGSCIDHMIVKAPFAIKMALGENPKSVYHGKNQAPSTRMSTAALIREQLYKAKRYQEEMERAEKDEDFDMPEFDMKCEALLPALRREIQVHFHAHRADDIFTAVRIAKEFQLDYVVVHGTEAHLIAGGLVETGTRVLSGPFLCDRSKPELRNPNAGYAGNSLRRGGSNCDYHGPSGHSDSIFAGLRGLGGARGHGLRRGPAGHHDQSGKNLWA